MKILHMLEKKIITNMKVDAIRCILLCIASKRFFIFNLQSRQKRSLFLVHDLGAENLWLLHCCISIYRTADCTEKISSALLSSRY